MHHDLKGGPVRRRARAWIMAGACCIAGAAGLPVVVAGPRWMALRQSAWQEMSEVAVPVLFLLWLGAGLACLQHGRMMLMLGAPEEREQKRRVFEQRVAEAEQFLEMQPPPR